MYDYNPYLFNLDLIFPASSSIMYKIDTNTWKLDAEVIDTAYATPGVTTKNATNK